MSFSVLEIDQLTPGGTPAGTELVPAWQGGGTVSLTLDQIVSIITLTGLGGTTLTAVESLINQAYIGTALWPRTAAEIAAGVTPINYAYPPGYVDRYETNTTPGTTDMSPAIRAAISAAVESAVGPSYIYFLGETYYVGSKITQTLNASISIHFQGDRGKTFIKSGVLSATTLELYDCQWFTMDGITFIGNNLTGSSGNGNALSLRSTNYGTSNTYFPQEAYLSYVSAYGFRGNDVDDGNNAMTAAGIYLSEGLANCIEFSNAENCGCGMYFDHSYNSTIRSCTISICDTWGVRFQDCSDGVFVLDSDINGNGTTTGTYSATVNGITIPYGGVFINSCDYDVSVVRTKMKNQPVAIATDLSDNISVEDCFIRLLDTASSHGVCGIWANRFVKLNVTGGTLSAIPSGTNSFHYTGIIATAGNNSGEASIDIKDHLIIPADTMDNGIHIDGNSSVNKMTINVRGVTVGNGTAGQVNAITVTNCLQVSNGTFVGSIDGNTWFAGSDAGSPITTIVNTIFVGSGASVSAVRIQNNADVPYNNGVITNASGVSQSTGAYTGTTDLNGDLTITHGLIQSPTKITATAEGTTPYTLTAHNGIATTFQVRVFNSSGSPVTGTNITAGWSASI